MFSHNIVAPGRSVRLPHNRRARRPHDRRSLSRSAVRALDVLELFAQADRPLRAVEISHALHLHPSTTAQLLKTMVDSGHLLFLSRGKRYFPSPRLIRFGGWLTQSYYGDDRLRLMLEEVHQRTGASFTIAAQNDVSMQIIDLIEPEDARNRIERGVKVPLFGSAIGAALLSERPDNEVEALLERARIPRADWPEVKTGLELVRREGHAFGGVSPEDDIWSVALPLPRTAADIPLVIGASAAAAQMHESRDRILAEIRDSIERWFPRGGS